jgi:hypothetical protein
MLSLRRGTVVTIERPAAGVRGIERLVVEVDGAERAAFADVGMVGGSLVGDDVVVNTEALDLELGSGGSDVVVANLTRGLGGKGDAARHVMKLNYTPIQSGVDPVEPEQLSAPIGKPVGVFQLHGQLAPVIWAATQERPGVKIGYVQSGGGALPGALSSTVSELRTRGLLCDHLTAAPAYGGEAEAMSTIGALHAGLTERGWDCAIVGPGPGIIGSGTALGHGGMIALDSAHAALALGCPTVLVARASSGDPRERHQGISHHTLTVLELLLAPVTVGHGPGAPLPRQMEGHRWVNAAPDLASYAGSGLPRRTMGRDMDDDELFFESALAGGIALARSVS